MNTHSWLSSAFLLIEDLKKKMAMKPKTELIWIMVKTIVDTAQDKFFFVWNLTKHSINHCEKNKEERERKEHAMMQVMVT